MKLAFQRALAGLLIAFGLLLPCALTVAQIGPLVGTGPLALIVQQKPVKLCGASSAGGTSPLTCSTAAPIPAGSLIVAATCSVVSSATSVTSISDGTNSLANAVGGPSATTAMANEIWFKANATAVATGATITVTWPVSPGQFTMMAAFVLAGQPTSPLDATPTQVVAGSGATSPTITSAALAQPLEMAVGTECHYSGNIVYTKQGGTGWSNIQTFNNIVGANAGNFTLDWSFTTATTAVTYNDTYATGQTSNINLATFKRNF